MGLGYYTGFHLSRRYRSGGGLDAHGEGGRETAGWRLNSCGCHYGLYR